jgi:N-acetylmuramate 1-kinase
MHLAAKQDSLDVNSLKREFREHFDAGKEIQCLQLAGDASSRKYFRLRQNGSSRILQWAEPFAIEDEESHPYIAAAKLLFTLGILAPKILASSPGRGWILMEDLGDKTLSQEPTFDRYKASIIWIEKMIAGVAEATAKQSLTDYRGPHLKWAFDMEKLGFEMRHTATHLVETFLKENSSKFLSLIEFNTVYLSKRPRFFCHRDYHSRNLMLHGDEIYVIDFQDARMGPMTYDIVSLLWDPYSNLGGSDRDKLLEFWKTSLFNYGRSTSAGAPRIKEFFEDKTKGVHTWKVELERMKVQRLLKAAGSYASFLNNKGRKDYLPWIRPALERTLESLETLRKFHMLDPSEAELLTLLPQYIEKL